MRLNDADALEKVIEEKFQTHYGNTVYQFIHDFFRCCIRQLRKAPTIDPASLRPKGEWIWSEEDECWVCSNCEAPALNNYRGNSTDSPFCPNCGADMRGE